MKIFTLLGLIFPLIANAGNLIYPTESKGISARFTNISGLVEDFKIAVDPTDLQLREKKESLLGAHYYYQQTVGGYDVEQAVLSVSVGKDGEILKIYDSTVDASSKSVAALPFISQDKAIELAWAKLKVNGELLDAPQVKIAFDEEMRLVYNITLAVSSPFGYWKVVVDAQNGVVLSVNDTAVSRIEKTGIHAFNIRNANPRLTSLKEALENYEAKSFDKMLSTATIVTGSAMVFDPNPTVTLKRTDLDDTMPDSVFASAYQRTDLNEITLEDGVYSLKGPNVTIIDFEAPTNAPSTTTDGNWTAHRGKNAFNDVMTYAHVDKTLRYVKGLGYDASKTIFKKSLEIDSDGVKGQDNSYYIPSSRRIAYGHGCVDDNEDTDVILHEFGHALQHHINSYWSGGDTGAMGESFGDYWASSYSASVDGGMDTQVNWVYKWDGHNKCWPGRILNNFTKYDSTKTYKAHVNVNNSNADEVFSTPIFQAFLELYKRGVPREHMDKIIVESQFGLGSGVKIPQWATAIVKTAKALYPDQDYAEVYTKHFKSQGIL